MAPGSITISRAQTLDFACLSGDRNPLHIDPLTARRTLFGGTVVHGVHATLAALDCFLANAGRSRAMTAIQVAYTTGLPQNHEVQLVIEADTEDQTTLRLRDGPRQIQTIRIKWASGPLSAGPAPGNELPTEDTPDVVDLETAARTMGSVPALVDQKLAAGLFPSLIRYLPLGQLATMLATTRIVGMRCPGMHSIYSGLKLAFDASSQVVELTYSVRRYDANASYLVLTLAGSGVSGEVTAFFRPTPVDQPDFNQMRGLVRENQFADQRALVIGGSRGLGELCAKALAAGGAHVILTWHSGESDAAKIVDDILAGGGRADAIQWDCMAPPAELPTQLSTASPTHIYYFATSRIELNRSDHFNRKIFDKYIDAYVIGLERSFAAARELWTPWACKSLFVPSTVFLDKPDATTVEYAAAKAVAELTAKVIAFHADPEMVVRSPRLPRVLTDQTTSVAGIKPQSAIDVVLGQILLE